jgi:cytidine deaminase
MIPWETLLTAANEARLNAHAPYSGFAVGAALLMEDQSVVAGCNVENRTFGLTICAERNAMARAVAEGKRKPLALVVVTDASPPAAPCGLCREALVEFVPDLPILLRNPGGEERRVRLRDLLPDPFVFEGRSREGSEAE